MGNINCKECFDKDINVTNEMLINTNSIQNESNQDNFRCTRSDRLKVLKSSCREKEIINVEESITDTKLNKNNKSSKDQNLLRKEERDNNILLKTELNKINKDVNKLYSVNNPEEINTLLELQRRQILAQEKIIAEYKNKETLFEEQQKKMEQTQKIIKEQQSLLNEREILNKKTQIIPFKQIKQYDPVIKITHTEMNQKGKKTLTPSKSTPSLKSKQNSIKKNNINKTLQELTKFERTQIIQPNFIRKEKSKEKNKKKETLEDNEENQIEENDNYERVEDYDYEEENINKDLPYHSQKFKIETYEPIEPGIKSEINEIINSNRELVNIDSEPRDSIQGIKKGIIPKPIYNEKKNKKKKDNIDKGKKRETGPIDSGQGAININFRGTFEKTENDKDNIKKDEINKNNINYKQLGPRDSKRRDDIEFNNSNIPYMLDNNNNNIYNEENDENINEVLIQQQEQFNTEENQNINIFSNNNNDNNIYFTEEYNMNIGQESPKFNEDIHSSMKTEENIDIEKYGNDTYGPYLNEVNDINMAMSANPVIYHKDYDEQNLNQMDEMYDIGIVENNGENPLIYSEGRMDTNY